jgi:hypothetical protein
VVAANLANAQKGLGEVREYMKELKEFTLCTKDGINFTTDDAASRKEAWAICLVVQNCLAEGNATTSGSEAPSQLKLST